MNDAPVVSIIVCTRNRAASLPETLQTLAEINASHAWEVLLIDNASSDGTRDIIEAMCKTQPCFSYHYCNQIGLGAAREFGRVRAAGRILAFTDDDCLISPDYVDQIVRAFSDCEGVGVLGGRIEQFNPAHLALTIDERTMVVRTPAYSFVPTGSFHGANLSFLSIALAQAGGFDPHLGAGTDFPCEDIDAVARVVFEGFDAVYDPAVIVRHDHGRIDADRPGIMAAYNRGRGAYYAKLIANKVTRPACRSAWLDQAARTEYRADATALVGEVRSALRFATGYLSPTEIAVVAGVSSQVMIACCWSWIAKLSNRKLRFSRTKSES